MKRKDEIKEFASKLYQLEKEHGVELISSNYHVPVVIVDKQGFAYRYEKGKIELDPDTYIEGEDE